MKEGILQLVKRSMLRAEGVATTLLVEIPCEEDSIFGAITGMFLEFSEAAEDSAAVTFGGSRHGKSRVKGCDDVFQMHNPDEDADDMPSSWQVRAGTVISKFSGVLQSKLLHTEVIEYYIEWCGVPQSTAQRTVRSTYVHRIASTSRTDPSLPPPPSSSSPLPPRPPFSLSLPSLPQVSLQQRV